MSASRRQRKPDLLVVIAVLGFASLAFQAVPGGVSERRRVSDFDIAQLQPRKDGPKAAQPVAGATSTATKTPAAPEVCDPKVRKLNEVSAALNRGLPQIQKSCATRSSPAQFELAGSINRAILVRPLTGDVDAFLSRNDGIIDVSMNTKRRVELILLPASGEFELAVSAKSPTATFEISAVQLARPDQKKTQSDRAALEQQKNAPRQAPGEQTSGEKENAADNQAVPGWVPGAFRDLGYDLIDPANSTDDPPNPVDLRAIMAFQAGERFAVTGTLSPEQVRYLANQAVMQVDVAAQEAVKTTRDVSRTSPVIIFPEPAADQDDTSDQSDTEDQANKKDQTAKKDETANPPPPKLGLKSMRGAFYNGRFFGEGVLRSGSKFEGEWLDGPTAGDSQRPALGVLFFADDCSATIKTFGMPAAGTEDSQFDESGIIANSIGVVRKKGKKIFAGDLAHAENEQLQSCTPASTQD